MFPLRVLWPSNKTLLASTNPFATPREGIEPMGKLAIETRGLSGGGRVSATKLLVLGIVHLSGGAHGYQVRSELQSWGAESWAKIKPGSIYHALKKAAADGLLTEHAEPGNSGREHPNRDTPEHVRDQAELWAGHARTELEWAKSLSKRLSEGAYTMADDPGSWRTVPDHLKMRF